MKNSIHIWAVLTLAASLFSGCASTHKTTEQIQVTPFPYLVTPNQHNQADMDVALHVPANYLSKRTRLIIVPQLIVADTVAQEFTPVIIDAPIYSKKRERLLQLTDYQDPYQNQISTVDHVSNGFTIPYKAHLSFTDALESGIIRGLVTTDGCGECTGMDTLQLASIFNPAFLLPDLKESLRLGWIEPKFVIRPKIMQGGGMAHLQFIINKSDINLSLGNNQSELDSMLFKLTPILKDTLASLNSLTIEGMASADGSLPFNTQLSRNRAASAKRWLVEELNIAPSVQRLMKVGSRPEGWEPVLAAMTADGNADSAAVKAILSKYADANDDVQERYIRRLPCWNTIKNKYLQKDRKVQYVYTYTLKSFTTDAELLSMYEKRPDAFNEEELLRVSSLKATDAEKMQVYKTILQYYPQSQTAAHNLAVLYLRQNEPNKALEVLTQLKEHTEATKNTMAVCYALTNNQERAIDILSELDSQSARYHLGLIKAHQHHYAEALELLRPFEDIHSVICALGVNDLTLADQLLGAIKESNARVEYLHSLVAARQNKSEVFFQHLKLACQDEMWKQRALIEPDFYKFRTDIRFTTYTGYR